MRRFFREPAAVVVAPLLLGYHGGVRYALSRLLEYAYWRRSIAEGVVAVNVLAEVLHESRYLRNLAQTIRRPLTSTHRDASQIIRSGNDDTETRRANMNAQLQYKFG